MNKIKQQFSDMRKNTPKHIQWLLLAAAFIVVLILLTLLMTGGDKKPVEDTESVPVKLIISPDIVDWADTQVGQTRTQTIKISASAPARILKVRRAKDVAGFADPRQTCTNAGDITETISCTISLEYKPGTASAAQGAPLYIDWRAAGEPESMQKPEKIMITLGAVAPAPTPTPKPVVEPIAKPEPIVAPTPVKTEIKREIESIAPSAPLFFEEDDDTEEYMIPAPVEEVPTVAEACSDFAFPGYNSSGNQIGWIKPERGAYYFHPFSDKNCDTPTGVYNPDNGIITSIDGGGAKIGTDAEHIGYTTISGGTIPQLSNAPTAKRVNRARQLTAEELEMTSGGGMAINGVQIGTGLTLNPAPKKDVIYGTSAPSAVVASQPYDRTFILRQYKPIPATIVSDVRADTALEAENMHFPVRATVDRNVYSDNGRTIIIPTGTLMLGFVTGEVPGPYKAIGRMNIQWYQFILPNGVEFNFNPNNYPKSADSQGRIGVPGRGSTDYLEQFVMPMLTAIVPAAVNMIAPVADKFVNQIDLDNNTVVQSGTLRSSELAKNEIITAWNQVAQKLMVDMMDNTVPPFTIPAGTRITVYSPEDLVVTCLDNNKSCYMEDYIKQTYNQQRDTPVWDAIPANDDSWVGQARSFNMDKYCTQNKNGIWEVDSSQASHITNESGYSYSTVVAYCQSKNYQAINNAKQEALFQNQQSAGNKNSIAYQTSQGTTSYNENVLGMQYADEDKTTLVNPFLTLPKEEAPATITCEDGTNPDANGCCTGEIYTDMGDQGFNCCPESGGDCFPPIL